MTTFNIFREMLWKTMLGRDWTTQHSVVVILNVFSLTAKQQEIVLSYHP